MPKSKFQEIIVVFLLFMVFLQVQAQEGEWKAYWKKTYHIESQDGQFKMRFGGRIQMDASVFQQDDTLRNLYGNLNNGILLRRLRFYNSGLIYGNIEYKLQIEFGGSNIAIKDAYIVFHKIGKLGDLILGHMKEPIRLEFMTSSNNALFIERGLPHRLLRERNIGALVKNEIFNKRLSYQLGYFKHSEEKKGGDDEYSGSNYAITGRIVGLPLYQKDKNMLLHTGVSFSYRKPKDQQVAINTTPENRLSLKYLNIQMQNIQEILYLGGEFAWVWGPFNLQGEYLTCQTQERTDSTSFSHQFYGYYATIGYFLTGESRPYKGLTRGFNRIIPRKNWGEGGIGAIQLVLRYSVMNLIDGSSASNSLIAGGQLKDITAGINWWLNPNTRISLNYILAQLYNVRSGDPQDKIGFIGQEHSLLTRFQVTF